MTSRVGPAYERHIAEGIAVAKAVGLSEEFIAELVKKARKHAKKAIEEEEQEIAKFAEENSISLEFARQFMSLQMELGIVAKALARHLGKQE